MKIRVLTTILSGLALSTFVNGVAAQTKGLYSSYFLKGATHRHELNPAFMGERSYVSFPGLGNLNIGVQTTAGVGDFLYPSAKGGLTTFMSDEVSANEFLKNLPNRAKMGFNLNENILSTGFYAWGGFNTFGISLKSNTNVSMPKELFRFMKCGVDSPNGTAYQIDNLNLYTNNYAEIALGHARKIDESWTVGAKVKFLVGLANAKMHIERLDVTATPDAWSITPSGAELYTSVKGLNMPTKGETGNYESSDYEKGENGEQGALKPGSVNQISFDDMNFDGPKGPTGFGMAFDFGASYKLNEDWSFSASVLDLGFISWSNTIKGVMNNSFEFNGFTNIPVNMGGEDSSGSFSDQTDQLADDFADLAKFTREGNAMKRTAGLAATLNLGAEYTLPAYNRLTFGLLSSTRIQGVYSWTEARLSANVAPLSWFEASANYAISNFGSTAGLLLNFHPRGFNFFVGMDALLGKVSKSYALPINKGMMNVSMGINFTFGDKH